MTESEKRMKKYTRAVERRLDLPKEVRVRVMNDFTTTITAMREAGKPDEEIYAELGAPRKVAAELNEQMKAFAYRKSPWRFVFLAAAILSGLWLAAYRVALWLVQLFTGVSLMLSPGEAASMGVIGGADGPTAIFLTSSPGFDWDLLIVAAILVACVLGYLRLCRCKSRQ